MLCKHNTRRATELDRLDYSKGLPSMPPRRAKVKHEGNSPSNWHLQMALSSQEALLSIDLASSDRHLTNSFFKSARPWPVSMPLAMNSLNCFNKYFPQPGQVIQVFHTSSTDMQCTMLQNGSLFWHRFDHCIQFPLWFHEALIG